VLLKIARENAVSVRNELFRVVGKADIAQWMIITIAGNDGKNKSAFCPPASSCFRIFKQREYEAVKRNNGTEVTERV